MESVSTGLGLYIDRNRTKERLPKIGDPLYLQCRISEDVARALHFSDYNKGLRLKLLGMDRDPGGTPLVKFGVAEVQNGATTRKWGGLLTMMGAGVYQGAIHDYQYYSHPGTSCLYHLGEWVKSVTGQTEFGLTSLEWYAIPFEQTIVMEMTKKPNTKKNIKRKTRRMLKPQQENLDLGAANAVETTKRLVQDSANKQAGNVMASVAALHGKPKSEAPEPQLSDRYVFSTRGERVLARGTVEEFAEYDRLMQEFGTVQARLEALAEELSARAKGNRG